MPKFYFTYGYGDEHPFRGGWTEVIAPDHSIACKLFQIFHYKFNNYYLDCDHVYSEEEFGLTNMAGSEDILKLLCHERITLTHELAEQKEGWADES